MLDVNITSIDTDIVGGHKPLWICDVSDYAHYECECGAWLVKHFHPKYCGNCGLLIDWSDINE